MTRQDGLQSQVETELLQGTEKNFGLTFWGLEQNGYASKYILLNKTVWTSVWPLLLCASKGLNADKSTLFQVITWMNVDQDSMMSSGIIIPWKVTIVNVLWIPLSGFQHCRPVIPFLKFSPNLLLSFKNVYLEILHNGNHFNFQCILIISRNLFLLLKWKMYQISVHQIQVCVYSWYFSVSENKTLITV